MIEDVPSPIDFRCMTDAREWADTALSKRPWRMEFFIQFTAAIESAVIPVQRILELGSGPGFLAEHLLGALPAITYFALDFSLAMHQLAAERLKQFGPRVKFIERSFRAPAWSENLGKFECVVTNQAVHELRHKHYASQLHQQVRQLLTPSGLYLICDHFVGEGGMENDQLYMTVAEQRAALLSAGFSNITQLLLKGGLVLHQAT